MDTSRLAGGTALLAHALLLLCGTAVLAQQAPADPLDALAEAREAYDAAVEKARERLKVDIDKRIEVTLATGRVEAVDELNEEKERFLVEGVLPTSPRLASEVRSFRSEWRLAARAFLAKLQSAERDLTRARRLDEARQFQQERTVLEAELAEDNPAPPAPSGDPAEAFQSDTMWRGFIKFASVTNGQRNVRDAAAVFRIAERNGNRFRGTYENAQGDAISEFEGTLGKTIKTSSGSVREYSFQIVRQLQNPNSPVGPSTTCRGRIRGGYLEGVMPPIRHGQSITTIQYEFRLEGSPGR